MSEKVDRIDGICYTSPMIDEKQAKLLDLSRKELKVLTALQDGYATPLLISRATDVSRTGAYDILHSLKHRGIVESHINKGRKGWQVVPSREMEGQFYQAKKALLQIPEGREEVHGMDDTGIVVHRGKEAIRKMVFSLFADPEDERFQSFQGDVSVIGWSRFFTVEETNQLNRLIKKHKTIVEAIGPQGWFEKQTKELGVEWAKEFEGRTTRYNVIAKEYFQHGGQMWIFGNSIYLAAMNEEVVIEIRNSEVQKMLQAFFLFMQENSRSIDANALLRKLTEEKKPLELK
jgi:hypothetical protein